MLQRNFKGSHLRQCLFLRHGVVSGSPGHALSPKKEITCEGDDNETFNDFPNGPKKKYFHLSFSAKEMKIIANFSPPSSPSRGEPLSLSLRVQQNPPTPLTAPPWPPPPPPPPPSDIPIFRRNTSPLPHSDFFSCSLFLGLLVYFSGLLPPFPETDK